MKSLLPILVFAIVIMFIYGIRSMGINSVNKKEFKKLISENKNIVLLDVRSQGEHESGAFDKSILIDVSRSDFLEKIKNLDKDKTYVVYCRSGARSGRAYKVMKKEGFNSLYNLSGGYFK